MTSFNFVKLYDPKRIRVNPRLKIRVIRVPLLDYSDEIKHPSGVKCIILHYSFYMQPLRGSRLSGGIICP